MKKVLRNTVQLKRQKIINKLIKSGIYKKNNNHLYELTLSDLEKEYRYIEKKIWGQE
ncbi:Fur-regulated basic protein FbpA [Bacillus sp. EB600]|uniref:Fur-regulated basic protein FbpA n=1 Tax=Bacillus sp. EB600 TaxID=2806345 RepID=UPI002108B270|nr:Fur-regulated basic protein FbpA [Bacillus sp. EB600]MCQ6282893.1 Fur-regulated basic protein FbpA [Bacillus sp. EB600]